MPGPNRSTSWHLGDQTLSTPLAPVFIPAHSPWSPQPSFWAWGLGSPGQLESREAIGSWERAAACCHGDEGASGYTVCSTIRIATESWEDWRHVLASRHSRHRVPESCGQGRVGSSLLLRSPSTSELMPPGLLQDRTGGWRAASIAWLSHLQGTGRQPIPRSRSSPYPTPVPSMPF